MPFRMIKTLLVAALLMFCSASAMRAQDEHVVDHDAHAAADGEHAGEHDVPLREDLPFWGIIAFIGFLFAVKKLGWDSLTSGMQDREQTERRLIAEAEDLRQQSHNRLTQQKGNMEALDEHVREVLAEADRDADHTRKDIRAAADREARTARARAEAEIGRVRDQSLHQIFSRTADRVAEETERRIRERLTPQHQQELVDAAVGEFVSQGRV